MSSSDRPRQILLATLLLLAVLILPFRGEAAEVRLLAPGTRYETELHIIRSGRPGPVVMVVGGVHGSERAGYLAARRVAGYEVTAGTLLVLPEANRPAVAAGSRVPPGGYDLNRAFPTAPGRQPTLTPAREIWGVLTEFAVDWLVDLHEGYDFYLNPNTSSVGQTIIYYPTSEVTRQVLETALARLNRGITQPLRRFTLVRYPVEGSLARAAGQYLGIHACIAETCSRLPLSTRIAHHLTVVDTVLEATGLR